MKVDLKQIVDELSEALNLKEGHKVSAMIDDNDKIVGWTIVTVTEDGTITPTPQNCYYNNLKELFLNYK